MTEEGEVCAIRDWEPRSSNPEGQCERGDLFSCSSKRATSSAAFKALGADHLYMSRAQKRTEPHFGRIF